MEDGVLGKAFTVMLIIDVVEGDIKLPEPSIEVL